MCQKTTFYGWFFGTQKSNRPQPSFTGAMLDCGRLDCGRGGLLLGDFEDELERICEVAVLLLSVCER